MDTFRRILDPVPSLVGSSQRYYELHDLPLNVVLFRCGKKQISRGNSGSLIYQFAFNSLNALCHPLPRENRVFCCVVFYRRGIDDGFKTAVAFPAAPEMAILMLTAILGPFGSD